MAYFAEIDESGRVLRVIVAASVAVCEKVCGPRDEKTPRVWVETKLGDAREAYASIGDTYDPTDHKKFRRGGLQPTEREP